MKAAKLKSDKNFVIVETDTPIPATTDVLIRVSTCGICKSDVHLWKQFLPKYAIPGFPGHEVFGVVEKTGSDVKAVRAGDTVTCISFPGKGYAEYVCVPENRVVKVKQQGSHILLGEPLACAYNIINRTRISEGQLIAVIGTGYLGLLLIKLLRKKYTNTIIAIDDRDSARTNALKAGASHVFHQEVSMIKKAVKESGKAGIDVIIEAAGTQSALDLATTLIAHKGCLLVAGYHAQGNRIINMQQWNWKGIDVINAHERDEEVYMDGLRGALSLMESEMHAFDMISHSFSLGNIDKAFELFDDSPEGYVKGVIRFNENE